MDKTVVDCINDIFYESKNIVRKTKYPCVYPAIGKHYVERYIPESYFSSHDFQILMASMGYKQHPCGRYNLRPKREYVFDWA